MDDLTREAIETIKATVDVLAGELSALADHLAGILEGSDRPTPVDRSGVDLPMLAGVRRILAAELRPEAGHYPSHKSQRLGCRFGPGTDE